VLNFDIKPYTGVDHYAFGDSREDTALKFGQPESVEIDDLLEETREFRNGLELVFMDDRLSEIVIIQKDACGAVLNGIDLFHDAGAVDRLREMSGSKTNSKRTYILFQDLGILLGGFLGRRVPEGKPVIVFSRDRLEASELFLKVS